MKFLYLTKMIVNLSHFIYEKKKKILTSISSIDYSFCLKNLTLD